MWRSGQLARLHPQAVRALRLLVSKRPLLVSQEELRKEIWGDLAVEWSAGLHQVMRQLRRALGDDARAPRYIETVPRRGYRWVARASATPASGASRRRSSRSRLRAAGIFLAGIATLPFALLIACLVLACL